mmetsp:Transcript_6997/g.6179  ORF Transcript_6997/g.6179 Transcript_6997/m.6179 type:complete len:185 (+) Transcript_6997:530-1084(+)
MAQFILTIGVLLMISVPTGLHAIKKSKHLPLIFTIFIYLEVIMSALHVMQVLIDRIVYAYSNDKDLMEQLDELPAKPKAQPKHKELDPYARVNTGFKNENERFSMRKKKGSKEILKEFDKKNTDKKKADFQFWEILKARKDTTSIRNRNGSGRKPTNMKEEFSKGVLSKFNKKPVDLMKHKSAF